jgi:hypothetical protein
MKAALGGMSPASGLYERAAACNPLPSDTIPFNSHPGLPGGKGEKIRSSMQPRKRVVRLMLEPFSTFSGTY